VSVGNELLFGETVDTNAAWLGRELTTLGISVVRGFTVGDVAEDIEWAVRKAAQASELVMVTGGLGPTPDDLTKATVAQMFSLPLTCDDQVLETLKVRYSAGGHDEVPVAARGQAEIPQGSTVLENPEGTAPGILLRTQDATVVLLPGVPGELRAIVRGALRPHLEAMRPPHAERVWHHVTHTTGIVESRLTEQVEASMAELPPDVRAPVGVAYLPDVYGVDLRFSAHGASREEALARIAPLLNAIDQVVAPYRFESTSGDLAEAVSTELRARGMQMATAESCTGGLIAKRITDRPGSSDIFAGGVVAYSNRVKVEQLGVHVDDIETFGAVSEVVAHQLAAGVAALLHADVGIGVTGVAGPGGGSEEKPVGTVWIGTCVRGEVETFLGRYSGDRQAIRARAGQAALAAVYRRVLNASKG
jgi:nicotinamide-nucleotide amidase